MPRKKKPPAWLEQFAAEVRAQPRVRVFRPLPGPPGPAWLPRVLRRLQRRFPKLVVRPPADAAALARLRAAIPACPADVTAFLSVCDGLDAHCLVGCDFDGWIYGVDRMIEIHRAVAEPWGPRYLPLRGDGGGGGDCLVVGPGVAEGAVASCEREMFGPLIVVASGLWTYLDMWSDWLVHSFDRRGRQINREDTFARGFLRRHPEIDRLTFVLTLVEAAASDGEDRERSRLSHPWRFHRRWMRQRDPGLAVLLDSPEVARWLEAHGHVDDRTPR